MFGYGWTFIFIATLHAVITVADQTDCSNEEPSSRYQAFAGEEFFFQCLSPSHKPQYIFNQSVVYEKITEWFYQTDNGNLMEIKNSNINKKGSALWFSPVVIQNSGDYICILKMENLCLKISLKVKAKDKKSCLEYGQSSLYLIITSKSSISCPSLSCQQGLKRSNLTWYKDGKEFTEQPNRFSLKINEVIQFTITYASDSGNYVCDYVRNMNGSQWIVRAIVEVKTGVRDTRNRPTILDPKNGTNIEAELGKPLDLKCRVLFAFEKIFQPHVKYFKLHPDSKEEQLKQTHLSAPEKDLEGTIYILTTKLDKVTTEELNAKFVCHAQNSVGNSTAVIKLIRKTTDIVFLVYILCVSVLLLLSLLIGSGMVYIHWIEIVLLYRNYISKDETIGDDKDFDAFVSYAKQSLVVDEATSDDSYDEERFATQLLPSVLEDKYNYKLCLLERDILPGGAYIEDIVNITKRSRRVIVILSQRYIAGPSLFELQAAINCALEEEPLKLILIKFKPFIEPESLPRIVKKALNALPVVTWKTKSKPSPSHVNDATKFWNRIRYHMPVKKNKTHGENVFSKRLTVQH
ncbi:interleukin-18 receptor accessory protein isoform X1 [Ascaphus truei]|uniref:interleukin-18 receptor accessory protein isoform X1 n=2 Tax=Ascaphus truei TaxID=8439 RepID=UPI003F5AA2E1